MFLDKAKFIESSTFKENNLNITHHDLDGAICAILLGNVLPVHIVSSTYKDIDTKIKNKIPDFYSLKNLYITDITVNEPLLEENIKKYLEEEYSYEEERNEWYNEFNKKLVLIDHHPAAMTSKIEKGIQSQEYAGCILTKKYLETTFNHKFSPQLELLATIGNDYDLWIHKLKISKILNRLFYYYGFIQFIERFKKGIDKNNPFLPEERTFIVKNDNYIKELFKNIDYTKYGNNIILTIATQEIDEVCEYLLNTDAKIDTVFCYNPELKKASMRGKDIGIDFGEFLKQFNGGGHKTAAAVNRISKVKELETIIEKYMEVRKGLNL